MNKSTMLTGSVLLAVWMLLAAGQAAVPAPTPYRLPSKMPDVAELPSPAEVQLDGFLGDRVLHNEKNRLLRVDLEPLLAGFRKKPGIHPWIGEHIGKWLFAASRAWANTDDADLRAKLDYAVAELVKAQEPDGYLGTYPPDKRFGLYPGADWDVWSHKYDLIGLLTYYHYTGNPAALEASRKIGDLLIATFGPGKKSILSAGTHMGMAATSVLEPVVLLYRMTGDERYLEFARYIVRSWDEPNGPKIIATLLKEKSVFKTANGKAYEMLSNLVGLCELARATGERQWLEPVIIAWEDIVAHRLYITGSASQSEHFHEDYFLPNSSGANVSETCVITTWIQLNSQLLRLTGQARYGDELERTFYNHLAAAQRPDGAEWCYFTPLEGTKPYGPGINCCVSSGPRGMALVPQHVFLKYRSKPGDPAEIAVNLFDNSKFTTKLDGQPVTLVQETQFPRTGSATFTVGTPAPITFALRVRTPAWAQPLALRVKGKSGTAAVLSDGWTLLPARRWQNGDRVTMTFHLAGKMVLGDHGNTGRAALTWGPFVLACDEALNPDLPPSPALCLAPNSKRAPLELLSSGPGLRFATRVRSARANRVRTAVLVPFADAGSTGGRYAVWLRAPGAPLPVNESVFAFGNEARSRQGNAAGAISDGDPGTFVVTFDGQRRAEDWFAVSREKPVVIRRVVFAHGRTFHDGGWFDTGAGKPRIQVQRERGGAWETVARLEEYPATTATNSRGLKDGQKFAQMLPEPQKIIGLRIAGSPACGDAPQQAFSSCAELQGFGQ